MASCALQDAKARLSELVKAASQTGPQEITVRGQPAVVVLSWADYRRLQQQTTSFVEFMRSSPLGEVELELERDRSPARDIDL